MGKFTEYKLPIKSMPVGSQEFGYQIGKQFFVNMEDNDIRNADIKVKLTVEHKNDYYDLQFAVSGTVVTGCDRCLDDLEIPIDTAYHVIVKYGEDYNDTDEYMEIPYSDNDINVAYMIHDTIALAIPIKHVHPMGKCNRSMSALLKKHRTSGADSEDAELEDELMDGIDDAADTPADSRWDKLKDLELD